MNASSRAQKALIILAVALSCSVLPGLAVAQDTQDFQTWSAVLGTADIGGGKLPVKAWFDGHARRGDAGTVLIARPALGYEITPWMSVWVGYAWVPTFSDVTDVERVDEHRAWQQLILKNDWLDGRLRAQSRTRLEQRFNDASTAHRIRQFARLDYRPQLTSKWGAVVWDELFWGLNDADFTEQGFDQNRVFVGPAFHATDGLRIEAGYLWAHLRRPPIRPNQHALAINFFVSF